jgi:hypothetical protein
VTVNSQLFHKHVQPCFNFSFQERFRQPKRLVEYRDCDLSGLEAEFARNTMAAKLAMQTIISESIFSFHTSTGEGPSVRVTDDADVIDLSHLREPRKAWHLFEPSTNGKWHEAILAQLAILAPLFMRVAIKFATAAPATAKNLSHAECLKPERASLRVFSQI